MAVYERNAKESLFSSLYRLLQIKKIDAIGVDEIVGGARVARSTFYRNFSDKYELLQWSYERIVVMTFSTTPRRPDRGRHRLGHVRDVSPPPTVLPQRPGLQRPQLAAPRHL